MLQIPTVIHSKSHLLQGVTEIHSFTKYIRLAVTSLYNVGTLEAPNLSINVG